MRLSYAVIYTPDQSQAKELETNVKYEVPGYSSKSTCISRSNKQSALDPYVRKKNMHTPNLIRRCNNNFRFSQ